MDELDSGSVYRLQFGGVLTEDEKQEVCDAVLGKVSEILSRGKTNLLSGGGF